MPRMATIIAFHAHPDDETLLTGGTLARLAAEGHRTVIVVACDGVMHEATGPDATTRLDELRASARALGVQQVVHLGYADSGHGPVLYPDPADRPRFMRVPVDEAAERLAELLRHERADILLGYDPQGGYGHPDHIRVYEVAVRAAELAETPRLLQATFPRDPVVRAFNLLRALRLVRRYDPAAIQGSYTPRAAITHRINVRRFAAQKRASLACHASELVGSGRSARLFRFLAALPTPVFGLLLGREWFVESAAPSDGTVRRHIM